MGGWGDVWGRLDQWPWYADLTHQERMPLSLILKATEIDSVSSVYPGFQWGSGVPRGYFACSEKARYRCCTGRKSHGTQEWKSLCYSVPRSPEWCDVGTGTVQVYHRYNSFLPQAPWYLSASSCVPFNPVIKYRLWLTKITVQ